MDNEVLVMRRFLDNCIESIFRQNSCQNASYMVAVTYDFNAHLLDCTNPSMEQLLQDLSPNAGSYYNWIHFNTKEESELYLNELELIDLSLFIPKDPKKEKEKK